MWDYGLVSWRMREENKGVDGKGIFVVLMFWLNTHDMHFVSLLKFLFEFNWFYKSLVSFYMFDEVFVLWLGWGLFLFPFKSHFTEHRTFPPQTVTRSQTTQTQVLRFHINLWNLCYHTPFILERLNKLWQKRFFRWICRT